MKLIIYITILTVTMAV